MKKITNTITRFELENNFYVEVQKIGETVEFYLCRTGCGMKLYMFDLIAANCPEETWEDFVEGNVYDYIPDFLEAMED